MDYTAWALSHPEWSSCYHYWMPYHQWQCSTVMEEKSQSLDFNSTALDFFHPLSSLPELTSGFFFYVYRATPALLLEYLPNDEPLAWCHVQHCLTLTGIAFYISDVSYMFIAIHDEMKHSTRSLALRSDSHREQSQSRGQLFLPLGPELRQTPLLSTL